MKQHIALILLAVATLANAYFTWTVYEREEGLRDVVRVLVTTQENMNTSMTKFIEAYKQEQK